MYVFVEEDLRKETGVEEGSQARDGTKKEGKGEKKVEKEVKGENCFGIQASVCGLVSDGCNDDDNVYISPFVLFLLVCSSSFSVS